MIKQRKIELLAPAKNLECGIEVIWCLRCKCEELDEETNVSSGELQFTEDDMKAPPYLSLQTVSSTNFCANSKLVFKALRTEVCLLYTSFQIAYHILSQQTHFLCMILENAY